MPDSNGDALMVSRRLRHTFWWQQRILLEVRGCGLWAHYAVFNCN